MMWLLRLWTCNWMPWHRTLAGSFWVSEQTEVHTCSCGQQWATNHGVPATLPYDDALKAFYSDFHRVTAVVTPSEPL